MTKCTKNDKDKFESWKNQGQIVKIYTANTE